MGAPKFKIKPEDPSTLFVQFKPSVDVVSETGCRSSRSRRLRHTLLVVNSCYSVKQKIKIKFTMDTEAAALCEIQGVPSCNGGSLQEVLSFPTPQLYWSGQEKKVVKQICWGPSEIDPDFNLQVEIEVHAYSPGSTPEEIDGLSDHIGYTIHGTL